MEGSLDLGLGALIMYEVLLAECLGCWGLGFLPAFSCGNESADRWLHFVLVY